ncbi:hypothetical protein DY000_02021763 [Brassica cretica]|uniref:Uncharacterized protein n=1 Tax=Brassica cretica TaxID=69181 RepID=A0ABQ7EFI6_BRACR|nr:hypothetical protein DY000_02021763 [Brassica cretica]
MANQSQASEGNPLMPPQTKQKSVKTPKITRENYVRPPNHNAPASYPWPRKDQEGQPIRIDDPMLLDFNYEGWDKDSAKRYNSLFNIEILHTRFSPQTLLPPLVSTLMCSKLSTPWGLLCSATKRTNSTRTSFGKCSLHLTSGTTTPPSQHMRTVPSHSWPTASSALSRLTSSMRFTRFQANEERCQ